MTSLFLLYHYTASGRHLSRLYLALFEVFLYGIFLYGDRLGVREGFEGFAEGFAESCGFVRVLLSLVGGLNKAPGPTGTPHWSVNNEVGGRSGAVGKDMLRS